MKGLICLMWGYSTIWTSRTMICPLTIQQMSHKSTTIHMCIHLHVSPFQQQSSWSEINGGSRWKLPFKVHKARPDMKNEKRKNTPLIISSVTLFTFNLVKYKVINRSCRPWCFYRVGEKNESTIWSETKKGQRKSRKHFNPTPGVQTHTYKSLRIL